MGGKLNLVGMGGKIVVGSGEDRLLGGVGIYTI